MKNDTLKWQEFEHPFRNKTTDWYWGLAIIVATIAIISIILTNFLFAIIAIIGGFTIALQVTRVPEEIDFELNERGLRAGSLLYPYATLKSFWVETEEGSPKIILESKKQFSPLILIPLNTKQVSTEEVRDYLKNNLKEKHLEEPFAHKLVDRLGL
jgi:hypothetical protein